MSLLFLLNTRDTFQSVNFMVNALNNVFDDNMSTCKAHFKAVIGADAKPCMHLLQESNLL